MTAFPHPDYPKNLETTARGPLVLLFYDGYEWQAAEGRIGGLKAQARRLLRYTKRSLMRQQVRTGFYTAFLALKNSLQLIGCNVRVNDFAAAKKRPHYPIGIAGYPSVITKVNLPNPTIFGPGDFGTPQDSTHVASDPRFKKLIQPSQWFCDVYRPYCGDKMMAWYAGIDTKAWPDYAKETKTTDYIIYDKIRWHRDERVPSILNRISKHIDATKKTYIILRYGHHHHSEFMAALKISRALIFVCEHETQGLAYQEALATNVPVLAWDEGVMVDPILKPYAENIPAISSVPYFDATCGMTFKIASFEQTCEAFWKNLEWYQPRHYVQTHLSLRSSAYDYLAHYAQLATY